ncbi:stage III sporulation protein AF [Polycladomyces sp. WAk]|uniref:Stage III sporulation protein AF n=1 Tax=Polycladomyces zharkentensis TaxID=2807616 RepID=A0ABS2WK43_9BACL|nr:stage III sporulation protein AF [Polycladomyces sp. WAk]MBN2909860.1 stage III sporulation protein AF [Polycladomyces sp. WAk]
MIELISDWLRQIVLLVLIATFIDLLLPNHSMDRYVKLVMGLLIILAILSPVFSLIRKDWDVSALAFRNGGTDVQDMTSLESIRQRGETLSRTQDRLIKEQAEDQMAQSIRREVENRFHVTVTSVHVQAAPPADNRPPGVSLVSLVVIPEDPGSREGRTSVAPVKEVGPVEIDTMKQEPVKQEGAGNEALYRRIRTYLEETWHLRPGQIRVSVEQAG